LTDRNGLRTRCRDLSDKEGLIRKNRTNVRFFRISPDFPEIMNEILPEMKTVTIGKRVMICRSKERENKK